MDWLSFIQENRSLAEEEFLDICSKKFEHLTDEQVDEHATDLDSHYMSSDIK